MRVAFDGRKIADFGIGTYIRGLLSGIAELADDVEVVVLTPRGHFDLVPRDARFRCVDLDIPLYSVTELLRVGRHAEGTGADLLHEPHYVVPFTRLPVTTTIHDLIHLHQPVRNPLARLYAHMVLGRAVRRSNHIFTVSHTVAREIRTKWPKAESRVTVTPNAAAERFTPGAPDERVLRKFGLTSSSYLLFVGNDKPHKNLDRLVDAFARVRSSLGEVTLAVAGGASRVEPGVRSLGRVGDDELPHLYRGALALVQPSIEEGFGLPVLEAMSCGTATVIASIPSLLEVSCGASFECDPRSVDSIAASLAAVAGDAQMREQMAMKGLERARTFEWKTTARATMDCWKKVMQDALDVKRRGTREKKSGIAL